MQNITRATEKILILNTISVIDRDAKNINFLKNKQTFTNYFNFFVKCF